MERRIELLAPAGGMKQLAAAVQNGADAVYMGGKLFNARMKADNFDGGQMQQAIDYAHLFDVKIYITMNTLLKNHELQQAFDYACELYAMGADGLILQDLGLAALCRERLPDFPIHLSTQGTVYNLSGVRAAQALGFSRVVLARETSLEEIRKITKAQVCEIEVFVHGAMCMCYSGQCQMSRILGGGKGRSGNRGVCAQPCRLTYRGDNGRESCALSPKDLCLLDRLGELIDGGVASLKIEGRMKSAEYVAAVTGIYRKYIDTYLKSGSYEIEEKDRRILRQIFNRGDFTEGYFTENPGADILSGNLPKHQGLYVGTVVNVWKKQKLIDVKTECKIVHGDGIELRNRTLTGTVVTYVEQRKGGILRIGDIKGSVQPGDKVYRITDANLMKNLKRTFEESGPDGKKFLRTIPVKMELSVEIGKSPVLSIREGKHDIQVSQKEILAEQAEKKPLTSEAVEKQLRKTGGTPFVVEQIMLRMESGSVLPLSSLNYLRRKGLNELTEAKKVRRKPGKQREKSIVDPGTKENAKIVHHLAFYFYQGKRAAQYNFKEIMGRIGVASAVAYLPLRDFLQSIDLPTFIQPIPYILNVSKGALDRFIEENLDEIAEKVKKTGIAVGNLSWMHEFLSRGVPVYGDYGLNICNHKAYDVIEKMGAIPVCMSHELYNLQAGPIPMMITEYRVPYASLTDRKNAEYRIIRDKTAEKNLILSSERKPDIEWLKKQWEQQDGECRIYVD